MNQYRLLQGDCTEMLQTLPEKSVHCVVTSPPYFGLRRYLPVGHEDADAEIGLEDTPDAYVQRLVDVFRGVWRVLRDDGTCWINIGDSYAGNGTNRNGLSNSAIGSGPNGACKQRAIADTVKSTVPPGLKPKDLIGIPWRLAFALQADGWYLRSDVIWHKPNPMPESVTDRPTKAHEYLFLLTKSARYYYDAQAIAEASLTPGDNRAERTDNTQLYARNGTESRKYTGNPTAATRNKRSVWTVATEPTPFAHFATMPTALVEPCILAGTSARGVCPQCGAPWARVVERGGPNGLTWEERKMNGEPMRKGYAQNRGERTGGNTLSGANLSTIGWQPSCECSAGEPVPATVLDPFAGSGTTLRVAIGLGRDAIGIELNPEYVTLAERLLNQTQPALFGV